MAKKTLFVIFSSESTLILIYLSHGTKIDPKSSIFEVSLSARGGLNPKWTMSHSYGNFVFDHGPYFVQFLCKKGKIHYDRKHKIKMKLLTVGANVAFKY